MADLIQLFLYLKFQTMQMCHLIILKFVDVSNGEIINGLDAGEVEITGCNFIQTIKRYSLLM